jgi:hypothetical protein
MAGFLRERWAEVEITTLLTGRALSCHVPQP